jgi:hypothetical protein
VTEFEEIGDQETVVRLRDKSSALVRRSADGVFGLRRVLGWQAVPKESQLFFGLHDRQMLADACADLGLHALYAIALEPDPRRVKSSVCRIEPSPSGLAHFSRECSGFNYLLCPPDFTFVIICSTDEFLVYAGLPSFLEGSLGASVLDTVKEFRSFAQASHWGKQERAMLLSVADAVSVEYAEVPIGTFVYFPRA